MDAEAPTGVDRRGFRRWMRWLAAVILLLPFVAFGLSNLALGSSWGRDWLSSKIQSRTTLETTIGGASWSPWNGVTFRDIRMEQPAALQPTIPEPLIRISKIQVVPVWKAVAKGHLDIRSIRLTSPKVVLPLEIISHFAPPAPSPSPTSPTTESRPPVTAGPVTPPDSPPPPTQQDPPPPLPIATPTTPTDFIHLENASFALVLSGSPAPIFEATEINGSLPVAGRDAESALVFPIIRLLGGDTIRDLRLPLQWRKPFLTVPSTDTTIAGLKSKIGARLGIVSGLPLALDIHAADQPITPLDLPGGHRFSAKTVSANTRFRGLVLAPQTWQADFITAASKPVIRTDGNETAFDQARTITVLRGGTLSCIDARISGDDVSLLGNATVLSNGKVAAVLRVVAPPETAVSISSRLFPGVNARPVLSAMSTPQRVALDIEASGTLGDLRIHLGKNGPLVGHPTPPASATPK